MIQLYYMSTFVTTNIRLPEEDYLQLKEEAAKTRKSLAAVIRERLVSKKQKKKSPEQIMKHIRQLAKRNEKSLKNWDSLKALREIRDEPAW